MSDLVGHDRPLEQLGQPIGQIERFPVRIVVARHLFGVQADDEILEVGPDGEQAAVR